MKLNFEKYYEKCLFIRLFEVTLIKLFSLGLLKGTTHTSIGQELIAVCLLDEINKNDYIISNHRCHAHFLAYCNEADLLLKELLGQEDGVCGGISGSQHIHYKQFLANGVLGNLIPVGAGIALSQKQLKKKETVIYIFMGDGVFGQGIIYETLNICSLYNLRCLFIVENNKIAQTTLLKENFSGSFSERFSAFRIKSKNLDLKNPYKFFLECQKAKKYIRNKNKPFALIIDTDRFSAHSKGDDTRSKKEINRIIKNDYLKIIEKKINLKKKLTIEKKILNQINLLMKNNRIDYKL